jgi:hypothetical protein
MNTNPNAGPWVPAGHPLAEQVALFREKQEMENFAASSARDAIRREVEASAEVQDFIQSKIDERFKELENE